MESIAGRFDKLAAVYERNRLSEWYKAQADYVLAELGDSADGLVLDVGCGTGWLLRKAVRSHPNLQGLGIDVSSEMIATARAEATRERVEGLMFLQSDWESIDPVILGTGVGSRPVTAAVCVSTFHYFSDPPAAVRKIYECLLPGAKFVLLDRAKERSMLTRLWGLLHEYLIRDQVRFYSSSELLEIVKSAGFREVRVITKIRKLFWKGKGFTSLVLISARK
jgi:ubiquinone/menaquinone biosynthesis C-methylase UbiE